MIVIVPPAAESEVELSENWSASVPESDRLILPLREFPSIVTFDEVGVPTSVERETDDELVVIVGVSGSSFPAPEYVAVIGITMSLDSTFEVARGENKRREAL